ncbi:MAG: winged helix-turn-helix transcriptional regulator [Candidatus Coatesbacteria bacterium]|nr:MAG: winged helix-turn-helix transcriptional regulator [Candidatus Coatesbacteria bacterium]
MDETIRILKALSDPTRLRIVLALSAKPCCVCELSSALELPQPTVSRCLRILRDAGVVVTTRFGRWIDYGINRDNEFVASAVEAAAKVAKKDATSLADKKRIRTADRETICAK